VGQGLARQLEFQAIINLVGDEIARVFPPIGNPELHSIFIALYNAAANQILTSEEMKKLIAREGAEPWPLDPKQLDGLLVREIERYRKAAKVAGIEPQ
jgi:tripartite-type tricarboxylate transporter receptor subunit TctC